MSRFTTFKFSKALEMINEGYNVRRKGWNGANQFVFHVNDASFNICIDTENDEPSDEPKFESHKLEPFLVLKNAQGKYVPWIPSQGDLDAEDWELVE